MPLMVYTIRQNEEWDRIVKSFENYDVYYLSGYVKAFQLHGDGEPLMLYYDNTDGAGEDAARPAVKVRGINVVMKRDIAKEPRIHGRIPENTWFDFVTPYGYGGWLIEGDGDQTALLRAYFLWCAEHHVVSEFVRYHPVLENHLRVNSFYTVIAVGHTIAMDVSSEEAIWSNLTSKNRNMIRKAQKLGVAIHFDNSPEKYAHFREIYDSTMDRDHADPYYYFEKAFYESVSNDLSDHGLVFYATLGDKIIAASIILFANGRMNYHLSGSVGEYRHLAPTNLLLYEAALWGSAHGYNTFHLGGGVGSREDNLYNFKKSFYRGQPYRFHIGQKVFIPDVYKMLVEMRDDIDEKSGFFPKYRSGN